MDNAKVLASFMVISGHLCYYNLAHTYGDTRTWLSGSEGLLSTLLEGFGTIDMPLICFVSGVLSQGPATASRVRNFLQFLVVPMALWIYLVKPVIINSLLREGSIADNLKALRDLKAFHEEWYLQALVAWRGSALLVWSHMRPRAALAMMLALSCTAGYFNLESGTGRFLKLDATLGFLPFFAIGYVFPFEAVAQFTERQASDGIWRLAAAGFLVVYCFVLLPSVFSAPLPDSHCNYAACGAGPTFSSLDPLAHALYWTRRLTKVALQLLPSLATLFLVLPRRTAALTWMGPHTLYPYLLHEVFNYWRNEAILVVPLPTITSRAGHLGVILLHVLYVLGVMCISASAPCRQLFDWCLKPDWVRHLLRAQDDISPSGPGPSEGKGVGPPPEAPPPASAASGGTEPGAAGPVAGGSFAPVASRSPPSAFRGSRSASTPSVSDALSGLGPDTSSVASDGDSGISTTDMAEPRWSYACRAAPWQSEAQCFYKYLLPCTLLLQLLSLCIMLFFVYLVALPCINAIPLNIFRFLLMCGTAVSLITSTSKYAYHCCWRLHRSDELPMRWEADEGCGGEAVGVTRGHPLMHVVVIVAYKEPIDVLIRTFDSIAAQRGVSRQIAVLLAVEGRDSSWPEAYAALSSRVGGAVGRVLFSEHTLAAGETVGKSSNENSAVRDLYRRLVEGEGYDPFEVMVTIVDADSVLSSTYLAHAEASFYEQPDGRRLIYSGPLNTYRNFGNANFLIQQYELCRCHHDTFHEPAGKYFPQSNYTLALGFAKEIDFWTPDNMPEDIHTANKAALNNFGGMTTVAIPSLICNDLVVSLQDRYTQAKRHMWGSVTELPWQIATASKLNLSYRMVAATVYAEAARDGSFLSNVIHISAQLAFVVTLWILWVQRDLLETDRLLLMLRGALVMVMWRWVCFWVGEHWFWAHLMKQFDVQPCSRVRWFFLVVTSPVCYWINDWLWTYIPTLHCLYHITFVGELSYVCAPKGTDAGGVAIGDGRSAAGLLVGSAKPLEKSG